MRRSVYRWVALLVSLGLFVSACSSGDGDSGDGSGEQGSGEPAPGRSTLQVARTPEPANLAAYSGHGGMLSVYEGMLMQLLSIDPATQEIVSDSLESWEVSEDGLTVTLHVRDDIEWTDGTPMTSADVVMSLEHFLDPSIGSFYAGSMAGVVGLSEFLDGEADSIAGLSAPDEYTVVVELEEPTPWLAQVAQTVSVVILPEHVLGDVPHDELNDHEYFKTFPVTNGPYTFVERVPGQHVELERNENWSLGEAGFERLFVRWLEPEVAPAQLETEEVQHISDVDPSDAERLGGIEGIETVSSPRTTPGLWWLTYHEPLLDARVRQAMAYAVDREGICEEVFLGYCDVPVTNLPAFGPDWAIPEGLTEYRYDPDRARELLDEAGWDPSTELTFLNWQEGSAAQMNEIVQGNLADVGINFTMVNVDYQTLIERLEEDPITYDATSGGGLGAIDPSNAQTRLACDAHYPEGQNQSFYCNEELDELFEAGVVEPNQDERAEIYHEAFRVINQEVPNLYLPLPEGIDAHDSRLKGVGTNRLLWNLGEWTWEE